MIYMDTEIKNKYADLQSQIKSLDKSYYQDNASFLPDFEYDLLRKELESLEAKHPELKQDISVSDKVGYEPAKGFKKIAHKQKMLSLSNCFSLDDAGSFVQRIQKFLEISDFPTTNFFFLFFRELLYVAQIVLSFRFNDSAIL